MIVIDSQAAGRIEARRYYEEQQQETKTWIEEQTKFARFNDDEETSPLNSAVKLGRPMHSKELESRLAKLNPKLVFIWGKFNTSHKKLGFQLPNNQIEELFVYEAGIMPERSMRNLKEIEVLDNEYVPKSGDVNPSDYEWVPVVPDEDDIPEYAQGGSWSKDGWAHPIGMFHGKWMLKDPNATRPGFVRKALAWSESVRGWRTVLVKLVKAGFLTVSQVEREFLNDNTPEWKQHMGFGETTRPW